MQIEWTSEGRTICDGVLARLVSRTEDDDGWQVFSKEVRELSIEAHTCPVYIDVLEEVYHSNRDGEGDSRYDSYWIEVRRAEKKKPG